MPHGFSPRERIRRRVDFQEVYRRGVRVAGRFMIVFVLRTERPHSRLGVAAPRKLGNAVVRNRAKRLVREMFRRNKIDTGVDVVVAPRRELLDIPFSTLEADYQAILRRRRLV